MSNEMVERVAKAIYDNSGMTYSNQQYYQGLAKAAIAAMREPTEEMVNAYNNQEPLSREAYRAMIDAALKE